MKKSIKKKNIFNDDSILRIPNILTLVLIFILIPLLYNFIFYPQQLSGDSDLYDLSGECSLSLCDCKCYFTNELPEVVNSKICGNKCYEVLDIKGCTLINNSCELVYN